MLLALRKFSRSSQSQRARRLRENIIGRQPAKHLNRTVSLPFLPSPPCRPYMEPSQRAKPFHGLDADPGDCRGIARCPTRHPHPWLCPTYPRGSHRVSAQRPLALVFRYVTAYCGGGRRRRRSVHDRQGKCGDVPRCFWRCAGLRRNITDGELRDVALSGSLVFCPNENPVAPITRIPCRILVRPQCSVMALTFKQFAADGATKYVCGAGA